MGARLRYLLGEVGVGLRRNLLMTVATVVTVTVSLALLGAGLLVQEQVNLTRGLFYTQVEVSIWLDDGITEEQRQSLEADLQDNSEVSEVIYESQEQAYENAQDLFEGQDEVLASVTPDLLPASFRVGLHQPENFRIVESQYEDYPGVSEVSDQREVLDRFFTVMDSVRLGAISVAALQLVAAAALISNTIRITAFARREQISIMKLVGAPNWYIRLPFILEGVVAGVLGALLAGGLLWLGMETLVTTLDAEVPFLPFIGPEALLYTVPWLLLIGGGLAALASYFSLRRFLAV
ncbi:ABC transporter permease [Egibacter rhizosphaerae]|uniref:Cell division protein FtsX n=1 Tax=Egibacter rhizosphaerae TaxID=1670831 RepID=A0A411YC65_9ACTN|nr:permease-like cell division protein FtsX [Egibacter rhizosphaerae]QBI18778.1 ABC transporter permease [Egibacter rhizosphaerae]